MTTPEENKEIVKRSSFEMYEKGDLDLIDEIVSEDRACRFEVDVAPTQTVPPLIAGTEDLSPPNA